MVFLNGLHGDPEWFSLNGLHGDPERFCMGLNRAYAYCLVSLL